MDKIPEDMALLVIDIQNDFLPGGALAMAKSYSILPPVNELIRKFVADGRHVIATRDWHPLHHISFKERGGPWPRHCVQNTHGAEFPEALELPETTNVFSKASTPDDDPYSEFAGKDEIGRDLETYLHARDLYHLVVTGLALDVCVLATVRDALKKGFAVTVVTDATKAVNAHPEDGERALEEMFRLGARLATSSDFLRAEVPYAESRPSLH